MNEGYRNITMMYKCMSEFNIGLDDSRDGKIVIRRGKKYWC